MDIEKIKSILDVIKETDIEEIWFEKGGEKSGFRRKDISPFSGESSDKIIPEEPSRRAKESIPKTLSYSHQIKSTMVGTFLCSSSPGSKPLVEEGDFVTIGQKVGIVEAMRVMKEVTSQVAGKIVKVLVADNHPVEYGQPLFEVEPQITQMKVADDTDKKK